MTTRLLLLLLVLLFAMGIGGFAKAAKQSSAKSKSTSLMPVLPPLPKTGVLKPKSDATDFTFIVAGDNRPQKAGSTQPAITSQLISDMKQYQPAFFLWTGDVIAGKDQNNPALINSEYLAFFNLVQVAGVPVFNAPAV